MIQKSKGLNRQDHMMLAELIKEYHPCDPFVIALMGRLKADNKKFDRVWFLKACGMEHLMTENELWKSIMRIMRKIGFKNIHIAGS